MPPPSDDIGGAPPPSAGLLRQLAPAPTEPELRLRRGIVQAIARPVCTVRLSGSEDPADDIPGVAYYASAAPLRVGDTVEILANGADWRVLGIVARATGAAAGVPTIRRYRGGDQAVAHATVTIVALDLYGTSDTDGMGPDSTYAATIKTPGLWLMTAQILWTANSIGTRIAWIFRNSARIAESAIRAPAAEAGHSFGVVERLNVGDVIGVQVYQTSEESVNVASALVLPSLRLVWLGE